MTKYDELMKALRKGQYDATAYMLCGEESYYIDMACQYIEQHVLDDAAREMDQMVVYGKDLPGDDISPVIGHARGFAMMGGRKAVIVKEAQTVKKWESLALYMEHPQPNTVLVICYKSGTPDKRLTVWKNFEKNGGVWMQSDKLRDYQMAAWIQNYLDTAIREKRLNITVDRSVPQLLSDYIGTDMAGVVKAVDKLILGMPEGQNRIDAALIERNLGISKDFNVFELQNALIAGDVVKANRITRYFASSKLHPMIKELGVLYNFFANLMIYHYLADKSERVAGPALGVPPFFVKDYALAARRFSAGKTFRIIGYFRETDARLKGIDNPSATDEDLWKELIYKILH